LQYAPLAPIWSRSAITLQPIRAGFPCFAAALTGYVEATRADDDVKNRLCPPSPYPNTPQDWARMQVLGARASSAFGSEPDIKDWANSTTLNPARIPPERAGSADVTEALARYAAHQGAGLAQLAALAGMS
jgi:hypothetical protein